MKRAVMRVLGLTLLSLASTHARADIPVPDPPTVWSRGQEPSGNIVIAAGAAISAVVVAAGLAIGRWPVKSSVGRIGVAVVAGLALLAVWGIATGTILQAHRDRGLWKQWEIDESDRRSRWRPPPGSIPEPGPPLPSAPASESALPTPPTSAAESVQ